MIIDLDELDDYLFTRLTELGYAPTIEEIEDIADSVIEFFMSKGVVAKEEGE